MDPAAQAAPHVGKVADARVALRVRVKDGQPAVLVDPADQEPACLAAAQEAAAI